jgi:hypothetical protein
MERILAGRRASEGTELDDLAVARMKDEILRRIERELGVPVLAERLGTRSVLATVHQNKSLSSIRSVEVLSDATNELALECAARRRESPEARPPGRESPSPAHVALRGSALVRALPLVRAVQRGA